MKQFAQLFAGRTDCFGTYQISEKRSDGKQKGQGKTIKQPVTEDQWRAHLSGEVMLGIVPNTPDNKCGWFALDIDQYDIDHAELRRKVAQFELPVVITRSKSGGAHLYCFVSEPIPAETARDVMMDWVGKLGIIKYDLFPKQSKTAEDGYGNWIILPYFGGDKTERYAFGLSGERLTVAEFEQLANATMASESDLGKIKKTKPKKQIDFWDQAPPCIQCIRRDGIQEGSRNTTMTHMCVFFKKVEEDGQIPSASEAANDFNQNNISPPLAYTEMSQIERNTSRKDYAYLCAQQPMLGLCDKDACKTRRYGVGPDKTMYGAFEISSCTKILTDPPTWVVRVNEADVRLTTEQLTTPKYFRLALIEACDVVIPPMKQNQHDQIITDLIHNSIKEEAPSDTGLSGQVMEVFREWIKNMVVRCKAREDILKHLPFHDAESGELIFFGTDLLKQYANVYRKNIDSKELWGVMRRFACSARSIKIKGSAVRVWVYPLHGEEIWFEEVKRDRF